MDKNSIITTKSQRIYEAILSTDRESDLDEYVFNDEYSRFIYKDRQCATYETDLKDLLLTIYSFSDTDFIQFSCFSDDFLFKSFSEDNLDLFIYVYEKHKKLREWIEVSDSNYEQFIMAAFTSMPETFSVLRYLYTMFSEKYKHPFYIKDIFTMIAIRGCEHLVEFLLDLDVPVDNKTLQLDLTTSGFYVGFFQQLLDRNIDHADYLMENILWFIYWDSYDIFVKLLTMYPEKYSFDWIDLCIENNSLTILEYLLETYDEVLNQDQIDVIFYNSFRISRASPYRTKVYSEYRKKIVDAPQIMERSFEGLKNIKSGVWAPSEKLYKRIMFEKRECLAIPSICKLMKFSEEEWLEVVVNFLYNQTSCTGDIVCQCHNNHVYDIREKNRFSSDVSADETVRYKILSGCLKKIMEQGINGKMLPENYVPSQCDTLEEIVRELFIIAAICSNRYQYISFLRLIISLGGEILPDVHFIIPYVIETMERDEYTGLSHLSCHASFLTCIHRHKYNLIKDPRSFYKTLKVLRESVQTVPREDLRDNFTALLIEEFPNILWNKL